MRTILGRLLGILLLLTSSECVSSVPTPHAVSIRILDAVSGQPLDSVKAALVTIYDPRKMGWALNGTTNLEGIVVFDLPDKLSARIGPRFAPDYVGNCSEVEFVTAQVLDTGVVVKNWCHTSLPKDFAEAKPGEIVIFATRISPWRALLLEPFNRRYIRNLDRPIFSDTCVLPKRVPGLVLSPDTVRVYFCYAGLTKPAESVSKHTRDTA
jgi:hypothetical protein